MSCPLGYGRGGPPPERPDAPANEEEGEENARIRGVYYHDYLGLEKVLNAQVLSSVEATGTAAHDEHLFIVIHQVYELWFKQILWEINSVIDIFSADFVEEKRLGAALQRLLRVIEIEKILIDQIRVLETMTPLDFLEFRRFINPASGFQSVQFRMLENKLGMAPEARTRYQNTTYLNYFRNKDAATLEEASDGVTLLEVINRWLERTPFLHTDEFNFWEEYRQAVEHMLAEDRKTTEQNPLLDEEGRAAQLAAQKRTEDSFAMLFDEDAYNKLYEKGERRLTYRACQAALLIQLYREEPVLHLPYRVLTALMDMDELLTTWRYRHVIMVQRMIGVKLGTGGSSGYYYLKTTVSDRYKVFLDLFTLSTYLIPRSMMPQLSESMHQTLGFTYVHMSYRKVDRSKLQKEEVVSGAEAVEEKTKESIVDAESKSE